MKEAGDGGGGGGKIGYRDIDRGGSTIPQPLRGRLDLVIRSLWVN